MQVAIQGQPDSFHHLAAERWFGSADFDLICGNTFSQVFDSLTEGSADYAITAIENSLYGSINEVYDLLEKHKVSVIGEIPERIHQQLIGFSGTNLADITHVYSHPVALNQCAEFLNKHLPKAIRIEQPDTAGSLDTVKKHGQTAAAIASHRAAESHNLAILKSNIEDEQTNFTRFLVLANQPAKEPQNANKASLILRTTHQPGALYRALGVFAQHKVNLTKLHSRPIRGHVWRYQFFIDAELTAAQLPHVSSDLKAQDCQINLLGIYSAAETNVIN